MEQDQPQGGGRAQEAGEGRLTRTVSGVEAVIFDLDGTLIDSEPTYREADSRFLLSKGILLSDSDWDDIVGMGGEPFLQLLKERHGLEGSTDALLAEKDEVYLGHAVGRTKAFGRTLELLRLLYVHRYPLAVGTSSRRRVLDRMLAETGLSAYFSATVSSDDVALSKPRPDTFLEAAARLGVPPDRCLVIEDSQYGVEAALEAGMAVVAVPAAGLEDRPAFERAHVLVVGGPDRLELPQLIERFELAPPTRVSEEPKLGTEQIARFQSVVWEVFRSERRPMPWRETSDPYRILVSEFMLQQTQVSRVVAKYAAFVNRFPDVRALAAASLQEVLTLWQGLGYNRRGKNLREAARTVVERFDGHLPDDAELLKTLPGVGKYTASAVAAFAFERPIVVLETNIRRVFLHHFFPRCESVHDRLIEPLVEATMPRGSVREWYYALMDYGARLGRILPNANRRSAHYTRQSAFHGSVREVRGRVIRALTREGTLTLGALERAVGPADSRLEQALESLEREGLIVLEGRRARLR